MESAEIHPYTKAWLNKQFIKNWEKNGGPEQTRHFMERLVAGLGTAETTYLQNHAATVLDWGCAMGEGVEFLGRTFPKCDVAGLDVARVAIEAARRRFPSRRFCLSERGEIASRFDVIVTSNCLEHFPDPWAHFKAHLAACNDFYVALVPYREFPRIDGHMVSFCEGSFPECAGGFVRISERVLATDVRFWHGGQLLVIYGSQSYVTWLSTTNGITPPPFWQSYFNGPPAVREALDRMAERGAKAESQRGEVLSERSHFKSRLEHLNERERAITYLQGELKNRDETIARQSGLLAALETELAQSSRTAPKS